MSHLTQDATLLTLTSLCEVHYIPLAHPPPLTYTHLYVIHPSHRLSLPRPSPHLWLPICYFAYTVIIIFIRCPAYLDTSFSCFLIVQNIVNNDKSIDLMKSFIHYLILLSNINRSLPWVNFFLSQINSLWFYVFHLPSNIAQQFL